MNSPGPFQIFLPYASSNERNNPQRMFLRVREPTDLLLKKFRTRNRSLQSSDSEERDPPPPGGTVPVEVDDADGHGMA